MKNIKQNLAFNNYSIKHQLLLIFLPLILLSTLVIGGVLIYDSSSQLDHSYKELAITDAEHTRSIIHDATNSFEKYAEYVTNQARVQGILVQEYDDFTKSSKRLEISTIISELRKQDTAIYSMRIYTDNPTIPTYMGLNSLQNLEATPEWLEKASSQMSEFWTISYEDNHGDFPFLTLYQQIPLPLSSYKAYIEIKMDYNYLNNRISNSSYVNQLFLNDGLIFYSDKYAQIGTLPNTILENLSTKVNVTYQTQSDSLSLLAYSRLKLGNQTDSIGVYSFDYSAPSAIQSNLIRWGSILLLFLAFSIFLTLYFTKFFTSRVQKLHEAVYRASTEDYLFFKEIDGHDEISTISLNFHKILNRMKKNEEDIYQSKLHEKELINQQQKMAFSILASQINPHFLFNTLETIRMTALKNQDKDVAHATKLLSQSMRYTLSNQGSGMTTLQRELDAIDVYTQIQQLRFGERVHYHCKVDSTIDTKAIHLLPLLIQPLIENAISHGLEGITENGHVTLTVEPAQNSTLVITVSDNGIGISPDQLRIIQERIRLNDLEDTNHIGLKNVHNRICQYYGEDYGLTICSQLGQGTKVQLLLPLENKN